ncbi:hypothetical protein D0B88_13230 [Cellvibrio sp. KY-YJ-3]|nr:hypothetical protein D0B88_13230 [Cellvibrio sp. KY-YJ-3]
MIAPFLLLLIEFYQGWCPLLFCGANTQQKYPFEEDNNQCSDNQFSKDFVVLLSWYFHRNSKMNQVF